MQTIVATTLGEVSGLVEEAPHDAIRSYRGIPYAAPPVGPLRWAPPATAEPWEGVRECRTFAPAALQQFHNDWFAREGYVPGHYGQEPPMSEDCLYLNVTTPAAEGDRLPVYVWFHGGGLTNGVAGEAATSGVHLARRGIVVVHVAHRINTFGYLCLPQLRAERGTSGNYGFLDQLKAMDWIADNIEAFGGDPFRVTVGGQSGGAQKAAALVAHAQGSERIRGVVSASGLKWMQPLASQEWAEEHGTALLRHLGIRSDATLEELRGLDASRFLTPMPRDLLPDYMVRDEVLPFDNLREGIEANALDVDFLSGLVLGEGDVLARAACRPDAPDVIAPFGTAEGFRRHFRALIGPAGDTSVLENVADLDDASAWARARVLACRGLTGSERTNISRNLMLNRLFGPYLRTHRGAGRVFDYLWSRRIPASPHDLGTVRDPAHPLSWHGADTWYLFGTLQPDVSRDRPWGDIDRRIADVMTSYIANFVTTGDPNAEGLPVWPQAGDDLGYLEIDEDFIAHEGFDDELDPVIRDFVVEEYRLADVL